MAACAAAGTEKELVKAPENISLFSDLKIGRIDAVVIDNGPAQEYMAANEGLKILETEYANEDYAIGFQKGNTALLEAVNAALAELKADGTFQGIVDKYIKAD